MYAHQVIEDLKNLSYSNVSKEMEDQRIIAINTIKESLKFHLDDVYEIIEMFKNYEKKLLFENKKYIKFPYYKVWIDFSTGNDKQCGKVGILVSEVEEKIHEVQIFEYISPLKRWGLSPLIIRIHIDKEELEWMFLITEGLKEKEKEETLKFFLEDARINLTILEFFLLLLNCKNITTKNHAPPVNQNKARRRKKVQELFTYKTLQIKIPSEYQRHFKNLPTGEHLRIHLCRGHPKEYTAEAPLFGKYVGLWWWQPQLRGQNKEGIVLKDYEVKT
jgi:hypothetical protein